MQLVVDTEVCDPALDSAISRTLLLRVAAGELPETVRISRPGPAVAFGRRDAIAAGYGEAVAAARAAGFEPIERLAGGRAAVFHEQTLHVGHALRERDPRPGVTPRFEATAALFERAFRGLGVDARVGEVAGEYCPGAHSVNARGAVKLMGLAQRVIKDGAYMGAVVVVDGADRINAVLSPIYAALGLSWEPAATGSLAAERPGIDWDGVRGAIEDAYGPAELAELDADTLTLARSLAPEHLSLGC